MPPPPQRFAYGGPVGDLPSLPDRPQVSGRNGAMIGELHLHGTPTDFMSESSVRRFLLPTSPKVEQRSGEK